MMKMKRRASLLRASPQRRLQFPFSTPQRNNDSSCRKRIKVRDLNSDTPLACNRDTSPIRAVPLKERHVTNTNNAKPSEFAFFKKFKEDANIRFGSSLLRQKELQSKKLDSSGCFRETTSPVKNCCKDFTSHFLVENVTPVNFDSMSSPLGNSSKISEVDVKQGHETLDIQSKQRSMENDDIFSRKRQKLHQFVQSMSFYGTGESYEKGSGVISMLLGRLLPESNQYTFGNNSEKLQWLPGSCSSGLDHEHDLNNNSSPSPFRLNKSRRRLFSGCSTNSDANEFHVKYRTNESDCELEQGTITLLDANSSPLTAGVEDYKSPVASRFKPRYGLYDHGEPLQFLLGWDIDNIKDESAFSSQLTELNQFAEPTTSFVDDHPPNLHEISGAVVPCSSPFPSSNYGTLYSFPYPSSASYQIHGSSRQENTDAAFNNLHLNFSYVPKCLALCDNHVDYDGSYDFFRAQSAHWLMNNVLDDEPQHPSLESLCASGFVFDLGWKYFSGLEEHCQKTAYHILEFPMDEMRPIAPVDEDRDYGGSVDALVEDRPPFFIQPESFFEERKVCSLLTDKINVDITEMDYI